MAADSRVSKVKYVFTIEIDVRVNEELLNIVYDGNPNKWIKAMGESADEFAKDLNNYLNNHPFVEASRMRVEKEK